jgi:CBS domain-containing protein
MLLGIDCRRTFTDAVVTAGGKVAAQAKAPTTHDDLLRGILAALDNVLAGTDAAGLRRVALSTTIVTNAVIERKLERVGLFLLPGPGMDISTLVPERPYVLSGYVDHRGRETAAPREEEVAVACRESGDRQVFAVAGKFAVRNPAHEQAVAGWLRKYAAPDHITLGSAVAGSLNFWRRANSAYYNAAVWRHFGRFARAAQAALAERGITAPVYILKADGGTMPLAAAAELPVEAVFTGPAASALGIIALAAPRGEAVSLDIGGTSTDIALWRDGAPLFAEKGREDRRLPDGGAGFLAAFARGGRRQFRPPRGRPHRRGPRTPRPGNGCGRPGADGVGRDDRGRDGRFRRRERAIEAMRLTAAAGETPEETAAAVLVAAADRIHEAIMRMIDERAAEPVYRVEDVVRDRRPRRRQWWGWAARPPASRRWWRSVWGCRAPCPRGRRWPTRSARRWPGRRSM